MENPLEYGKYTTYTTLLPYLSPKQTSLINYRILAHSDRRGLRFLFSQSTYPPIRTETTGTWVCWLILQITEILVGRVPLPRTHGD